MPVCVQAGPHGRLIIQAARINAGDPVLIRCCGDGDRPAAYAAVFDILLMFYRTVYGDFDCFAAIRALDCVELQSGHGVGVGGGIRHGKANSREELGCGAAAFTAHQHFHDNMLTPI